MAKITYRRLDDSTKGIQHSGKAKYIISPVEETVVKGWLWRRAVTKRIKLAVMALTYEPANSPIDLMGDYWYEIVSTHYGEEAAQAELATLIKFDSSDKEQNNENNNRKADYNN